MSNNHLEESDIELNIEGKSFNYKDEPIQLINFDNSGFKLNQEAFEILNSIEEDLIIVSVVGKARTGKSYLMNLLLDNVGTAKGFKVDSKISSCTKGIWMWGNYRNSVSGNGAKIIFIDSEGTSATDRGTRTYDSRIFALIVLISSLFIYNTTSNIDEHGISELSLAAHLSNAIKTNSGIDKESLISELSPKFIWVLRDFTLEKIHPETGQEISSKEYLEICLRKKISGKNSNDNNLIRNNIIKYFPERDCVTLIRPVESESELRDLNNIPLKRLKPNFVLEFKNLKDKIYKETLPKKLNGKKLNGPALAFLISEFVNTINSGTIPNINNSWDSVVNKDIKDYKEKALNFYKNKTNRIAKETYDQDDLVMTLADIKGESMQIYHKLQQVDSETLTNVNYLNIYQENEALLQEEIKKIEEKLVLSNLETTTNQCREVFKSEYMEIGKKTIDREHYTTKTIAEFNEDYASLLRRYNNSEKAKGGNKLKVLCENLIAKEKDIIEYWVKQMKKENDKKLNDVKGKLQQLNFALEDGEKINHYIKEKHAIDNDRIKQLEKNLKLESQHFDDLNERLENLNNEVEIVKKSQNQGISYKQPDKKDLGDIVDSIDKRKAKKGEKSGGCQCRCLIY